MTEATKDHLNLPQAAKPTVFHHEGRRLFLIDGEPRIVDVDLAQSTGLRRDRKIRDVIRAQRENLVFFGSLVRADADQRVVSRVNSGDDGELPLGGAIPEDVFAVLEAEGVLDPSRPGKQPVVWLLNKDQMRWVVGKSRTPESDEFLRELFRVYKAWEAGTLGLARPAVEPPTASGPDGRQALLEGLRASVRAKEDVDLNFFHREGIVFAAVLTRIHVLADSVAEALGMTAEGFAAELARWPCLSLLAEMPELGVPHGPWLARCHVTFLLSRPGLDCDALRAIAGMMEAYGASASAYGGEYFIPTADDPEGGRRAHRPYVRPERWRSEAAHFMRDRNGSLRVRHDAFARMLGRGAFSVEADVRRYRHAIEDVGAKLVERFEVSGGEQVIGLYLTLPQAARLAELIGSSAEAVLDSFEVWREVEAELVLAEEEDRRDFAASGAPGPGFSALASHRAELSGVRSDLASLRADLVSAGVLPAPGGRGALGRLRLGLGRIAGAVGLGR